MNRNKIPMKSHQPTNHRYNNQSPKYRDPAQHMESIKIMLSLLLTIITMMGFRVIMSARHPRDLLLIDDKERVASQKLSRLYRETRNF